ncbi:IS110 family transposase [Arthrobacter sp. BE255]|uniref:IS110 family transposase n=1 Tax=Arthrobacter sp. BE255 TaxID=2817721 RepID=UPI00286C005B|nr:IS110 family transposase [Arthrobacter sp. BE255]
MAVLRDYDCVDVFIGVDVGKDGHHAVALDKSGNRLLDRALPNDEDELRQILQDLGSHGRLLFVVDQPATVGALAVAVARADGAVVGYLPGLAMRRIADLHPGEAKTDARDAFIIAEAARSLPGTLRSLELGDEQRAELVMLCGFDDDLVAQATATSHRIRGLLTQIHPALERVLGPRLDHPAVLDLLRTWPTPQALRQAGTKRVAARLRKLAPRIGERLAEEISQALDRQTVVVSGTESAGIVLAQLAGMLDGLHTARNTVLAKVEALVEAHPLHRVLTSLPAVGVRTEARILTEIVGKEFQTAAHLASYAGLAPVTWRSGSSIRADHASRKGNKVLKRTLYLSAFAALKDPLSKAYYDRKRAEGKRHNQALIALARRRCDTLFAMLRDGSLYHPKTPQTP